VFSFFGLFFRGFSVVVVFISGASVVREYVDADIDEGGREEIKVESVQISCFVLGVDRVVGEV
jgi:hypothetical protein